MNVDTDNFSFETYLDNVMDYSPEEQQFDTYVEWDRYESNEPKELEFH